MLLGVYGDLVAPVGGIMSHDPLAPMASFGDAYCPHNVRRGDWCEACMPPPDDLDEMVPPAAAPEQSSTGGTARLELVPASSLDVNRTEFLWERRIPTRAVTLAAGLEGMGKTALVGHLAARVTRGDLPGDRFGRPLDVVYIGTEDDERAVLLPRLMAAGADLARFFFVHLPDGAFELTVDGGHLAEQMSLLNPGLVIIDPLDSHLGRSVDSHRKADVQAAIGQLARLVQRHNCAGLGIAHLNKGETSTLLNKVIGSRGFTSAVRSVLGVGEHPDDAGERLCVLAKSNYVDKGQVPAIRFRVESTDIDPGDGGPPVGTAKVAMLGHVDGVDPNVIIDVPSLEERTKLDECEAWLRDLLSVGSMPAADVKRLATGEDYSSRTLDRARSRVGVVSHRDDTKRGRPATWQLP